jgi:hypothetical protein
VLAGTGKGNFNLLPPVKTGLRLSGEVKEIQAIRSGTKNYILVLQNNQKPVLLTPHTLKGDTVRYAFK